MAWLARSCTQPSRELYYSTPLPQPLCEPVRLFCGREPEELLSYAKQYCRYGMEVAMLANKTDAAFFHVATETGMGAMRWWLVANSLFI